jgi:hypothetical protein
MTDTEQLIDQGRHMAKLHPGHVWAETMKELCDALVRQRGSNDLVGFWLSGALDDPEVCVSMKEDIRTWMEATDW